MISRKQGHIVSLASLSALTGAPHMLMYATTKFAIRGFMESLSLDLAVDGHDDYIKTTTVYPSFVATNCGIVDFVSKNFNFGPILEAGSVAEKIVRAIESNSSIVTMPFVLKYFGYLM